MTPLDPPLEMTAMGNGHGGFHGRPTVDSLGDKLVWIVRTTKDALESLGLDGHLCYGHLR